MGNLAKPEKPAVIKLRDGIEYELDPIDLNIMTEIEEKFERPCGDLFREGWIKALRMALWLMLKDHTDKTEAEIGKLMTGPIIIEFQAIIAKQMGG